MPLLSATGLPDSFRVCDVSRGGGTLERVGVDVRGGGGGSLGLENGTSCWYDSQGEVAAS